MARGAPNKRGLDYFPKMLNFYDDDKIFDLMDEYGPMGVTIYDVILTIVYSQGYFAELSKDKLSRMVIRKIGNKWIKNQRVVVQVIDYCADLGLFDKALLAQNVITSEGIQRRYHKIAVKLMKRQLYSEKYWLLEKEEKEEPLLNSPKNRISSEENQIDSAVIPNSSEESHIKGKETKRNNINTAPPGKPFDNPELEKAFQFFLLCRRQNGKVINEEQVRLLREELCASGEDDKSRLAVAKKAAADGWTGFHALRKPRRKAEPKKKAGFNNFQGRSYDVGKLESQLLNSQKGGKDHG
ncbi:DUF4373 domain-containing protein [Blautia producta]|uniref:DUF4373 domain-containing protein n=2 Tax=Blautia producta TaxID=33035 RepID=A0A7G5N3Z1_9FIRM|nr:DUF4373 domain-containing protein [Blautia producta ATCC 27340 = DSM 2950]QMW81584.1 DUF4373 domain-containing protein [Blautia producta]